MCDYSLVNVKSRPAKIGDKLTTQNFGTGTRGFAASEDASVAVDRQEESRCPSRCARISRWAGHPLDVPL